MIIVSNILIDLLKMETSTMDKSMRNTSTDSLSATDLLELKNRLLDELKILEIAKTTAGVDEIPKTLSELQRSLKELKDQLLEESNKISLKEIIIKRLEMHELLCGILFQQNKDERDSKITSNCLNDMPVASEIMRIQKDVEALQEKYDNLKMDNLKLKCENQGMMEKLKDKQENTHCVPEEVANNNDYRLLKSELEMRSKSLTILKNVIPRLVVGAGLRGPLLQDLILQCGEPSNI